MAGYRGATLNHNQVSIATTATVIVARSNNTGRTTIKNLHATEDVFLGGSGVTTSNGFPLEPGEAMSIESMAAIYGIVASGTATVAYFQEAD